MGSNAYTTLRMMSSTDWAFLRCGEVRISTGCLLSMGVDAHFLSLAASIFCSRLIALAMRKYCVSGMFDGQT